MSGIPFHEIPDGDKPYETVLGHAHIADGVIVATVLLLDDGSLAPDLAGKGAILFEFARGQKRWPPLIFIPADDDPAGDAFIALVRAAFDKLPDAASWAPRPAPKDVHCPGCGVLLFNDVARRGACFSCYPTLPGDETR